MTPTEQHVLSKYSQTDNYVGLTIQHYHQTYEAVIIIFQDNYYLKLKADSDYGEACLEEYKLDLFDLREMGLITEGQWDQHLAEKKTQQEELKRNRVTAQIESVLRSMSMDRLLSILNKNQLVIIDGHEVDLEEVRRAIRKKGGSA